MVIERDLCLSLLHENSLIERKNWLDKVNALDDDGLIERRISCLLDVGKPREALELLNSRIFEPVHQRYERTRLWQKVQEDLNENIKPPLARLGEDDLAIFGAYRITNQ